MLPENERAAWLATFDDGDEAEATAALLDAIADAEYEPDDDDAYTPFVYPH